MKGSTFTCKAPKRRVLSMNGRLNWALVAAVPSPLLPTVEPA